jgi:hypothetical protein
LHGGLAVGGGALVAKVREGVRFQDGEPLTHKHVNSTGHAATLELAETEVDENHWSRRNGG